ncbi:MAG: hypothetical protein WEG36_00185 [Gemmatimonadota bacterium]
MHTLNREEMALVHGGGFWSGVACGLGAVTALVAWTSPDPFSKLAILAYGGGAISCITAYL